MHERDPDIEIFKGSSQTVIRGLTSDGRLWIMKNMSNANKNGMLRIANEFADEVVEFIKANSLKLKLEFIGRES